MVAIIAMTIYRIKIYLNQDSVGFLNQNTANILKSQMAAS
jgi:hypothetical protein